MEEVKADAGQDELSISTTKNNQVAPLSFTRQIPAPVSLDYEQVRPSRNPAFNQNIGSDYPVESPTDALGSGRALEPRQPNRSSATAAHRTKGKESLL